MITPIEIRQHTFKKAFQGYNKDDVQNYLNTLSSEWERMVEDNKRLKSELEKTTSALDNLRQVESALHRTLLQAEETSKSTIESAKATADQRIEEAEAKAKEMLRNAIEDRSRIEMQTSELVQRRNEILQQLKSYLGAQTERLKTFEEKEMKMPIMNMPPATPSVQPVQKATATPADAPKREEKAATPAPEAKAEEPVKETPKESPKESPKEALAAEKTPAVEAEAKSFFEKSVVSAPVSTVINDIADEL